MALVFEQFLTESIGDASYLVGDDAARVAAVVDPQVDIQRYVDAARKHGVAITHVVQTHIHEDYVSGAIALANACGGAEIWVSGHDAPDYRFEHRSAKDADVLELVTRPARPSATSAGTTRCCSKPTRHLFGRTR